MQPTLAEQLLKLFPTPPDRVYVAPNIPEKKLNGARSYASWGQETPLIVFDNTMLGSAKNGAVFTNLALYVDTQKERIDLGWIRAMPFYSGDEGTFPTAYGTARVPRMMLADGRDAFDRVMEVIVGWNTGALAGPVDRPPVPGPIGELAARVFAASSGLELAGRASRAKIARAAARSEDWIDTLACERIVAFGEAGAGGDHVALTDRRLLAHTFGRAAVLPYVHLLGARAEGGSLTRRVVIDHAGGSTEVSLGSPLDGDAELLAQFLQGIAALPLEQRCAPPEAVPSPQDPSGAEATLRSLPVPDPRLPILLRLVQAGLAAGRMNVGAACDHVARVRLFAANAATGRGAVQGARVSPLHGEDLAVVLGQVLGEPAGVAGDAATRFYDYRLVRRGSAGSAAASTAVGLAALAIVGVGWVSRPGTRTTFVRVAMRHLGSATGFSALALSGAPTPLGVAEPQLFADVLETVADAEPVVMLGRILWGWQAPTAALLSTPPQAFVHQVGATIGWTDLTPFFAK
jgi:hypothetical protein